MHAACCCNVARSAVCVYICVMGPANTAELIEVSFRVTGSCRPKKPSIRWGAYWRHLANTIDGCMRSGYAALSNYFDHLFHSFITLAASVTKSVKQRSGVCQSVFLSRLF